MNKPSCKSTIIKRSFARIKGLALLFFFLGIMLLRVQAGIANKDDEIINGFIESKGYKNLIIFDSNNIKQYWTDNNVFCKDNNIYVCPTNEHNNIFESNPLKIQLSNVNESMDCHISIIADKPSFSFSVRDGNNILAEQSLLSTESFMQYTILSTSFHLEDTNFFSFSLVFSSNSPDIITFDKLIISFSENKSSKFLFSPGVLTVSYEDLSDDSLINCKKGKDSSLYVSGKSIKLTANKYIIVSNKSLVNHLRVKNIGENSTRISLGYTLHTKDKKQIRKRNTPYNSKEKGVKVLSTDNDLNRIIVDSYPDWTKGCYLATNVKEDQSDIPNFSLLAGKVNEVNKTDNGHAEIILDKKINTDIPTGSYVRLLSSSSSTILYTNRERIQPGEEIDLDFTIKKDDSFLDFSSKAFCRGTYYVIPVIIVDSPESAEESSVIISEFTVSY